MHEENFISSWLREDDVEGETTEMERLKEEAKHGESKRGKREVVGERIGAEIKVVWIGCLAKFSRTTSEVESVGDSCGFSVCVCLLFFFLCLFVSLL